MKRLSRAMFSAALAAALAVAVGFGARAQNAVRHHSPPVINDSDMTLGGAQWVQTLDPATEADVNSGYFTGKFYGYLVELSTNGQAVLDLAQSYKISKDHLTYTFKLKKGLKFYDGHTITPYDVKWSLARSLMPKIANPYDESFYYGNYIKGAGAVNVGGAGETITQAMRNLKGVSYNNRAGTISITTNAPTPFFLKAFTYASFAILDPKAMADPDTGDHTQLTDSCDAVRNNAAGPFIPVCLNAGRGSNHASFFPAGQTPYILMKPNPRYGGIGGKPKFEIKSEVIDTREAAYAAYRSGSEDIVAIPPEDLSGAHHEPDSRFLKTPTSSVFWLAPNLASKPFSSFACRMVVAWGINRDTIAKIWGNEEAPIYDILPPNIPGHYPGAGSPHYNPKRARSYLSACARAIGSRTLSFDIPYSTAVRAADNEFRAIRRQLDSLRSGKYRVNVTIDPLNANDYYNLIGTNLNSAKNPDWSHIAETGWQEDFPDAWDYCTLLLRAGQNYDIGNFDDKRYNALVDEAGRIFNQRERNRLYIEAQKIALSQGAWITLTNSVSYALIRKSITGLNFNAEYYFAEPTGLNWASVHVK